MWESIDHDRKMQDSFNYSFRLKIPGGWLVKDEVVTYAREGGIRIRVTFILDKEHAWVLKK